MQQDCGPLPFSRDACDRAPNDASTIYVSLTGCHFAFTMWFWGPSVWSACQQAHHALLRRFSGTLWALLRMRLSVSSAQLNAQNVANLA